MKLIGAVQFAKTATAANVIFTPGIRPAGSLSDGSNGGN
jgi:hypothetical protein